MKKTERQIADDRIQRAAQYLTAAQSRLEAFDIWGALSNLSEAGLEISATRDRLAEISRESLRKALDEAHE